MKIPFLAWTGKASLEIEIPDDTDIRFRFRASIEIAVKHGANLGGANLGGADLYGADLYGANLYGANLRDANLYGADLYGADLYGADLRDANLGGADLYGADLYGADLYGANLRDANLGGADLHGADLHGADLGGSNLYGANLGDVRSDFLAEVLKLPNELDALRDAIAGGRIDGSTYSDECACLAGTLARARGDACYEGEDIEISSDITFHAESYSPRERFFMAIKRGDTPETNPAAAIALGWAKEAIAIRDLIRATAPHTDSAITAQESIGDSRTLLDERDAGDGRL
jgi:hypothetical protein